MTTTDFIMRFWRSTLPEMIGLLAGMLLGLGCLGSVQAQPVSDLVSPVRFERVGDSILMSTAVNFSLPEAVEDALLKGIAIIFVAEVDIVRERWYWTNKRVASVERHTRLAYQPLTRRWRLNISSGALMATGLALSLNQNFDTLEDALAALQRLHRWKIAEATELDLDRPYLVEFRFHLDMAQLPRPLQIGALGQSDWNVSVALSQPLVLEGTK